MYLLPIIFNNFLFIMKMFISSMIIIYIWDTIRNNLTDNIHTNNISDKHYSRLEYCIIFLVIYNIFCVSFYIINKMIINIKDFSDNFQDGLRLGIFLYSTGIFLYTILNLIFLIGLLRSLRKSKKYNEQYNIPYISAKSKLDDSSNISSNRIDISNLDSSKIDVSDIRKELNINN